MKTVKKYSSFKQLKSSEHEALDKDSADKKHKKFEIFIKSLQQSSDKKK
ncbi:hypothetical protein [Chryseobacterium phocaeense]|nr:hypothetical protein [Chryseobacterium phocaeense]